jgi:DDE superfamily endonuclease
MQHLLGRARWDADRVRDDVREYVLEHLGDDEDAVLVADETGDVKKGTHTVAVQRQYTGSVGRIENAQVAVYLVHAAGRGHAAVDRELYVPRSWTCDPDRCRAAGLGEDTVFATKPELAARMIGRFLDAGHRVGWVAGDEVYGGNPKLRSALEERKAGYVLAVACSAEVTTGAEETFQAGKGPAGLDEHQLRRFTSWSRWGHPCHARPPLPRRRPRRRTHPPSRPGRADPAHLQRDPAPVHDAGRPARARRGPPAPLVRLAASPSGPSPGQPLPEASRESDIKITIYGWSTSEAPPLTTELHGSAGASVQVSA